jgi:uracil-DNA glycosylase
MLTCRACPQMVGPVTSGRPVLSKVLMIGQAPGDKEGAAGKPFAWTAGKTLFKWYAEIGLDEEQFRSRAYMAAVCRCFPGKAPKGGDRVPAPDEIARCSRHLEAEVRLLEPELVIPVGKLAIAQVLPEAQQLVQVVGTQHRARLHGHAVDVIPLPHPSGASTWHRTEPGRTLLAAALSLIGAHPAWRRLLQESA